MILAILERIETIEKDKPFETRYYLDEHFKKIFDELNITLFPIISEKNLEKICSICDGLVIPGSSTDIPPHYYGEVSIADKDYSFDEYKFDKQAIEIFTKYNKPILGICGGIQAINVYFGGSLNQKIENHKLENQLHKIIVTKNTFLNTIYHNSTEVNSFHRQSIKDLAPGFTVSAIAEDGTIEAIEKDNIIAVQWHPEEMHDILFFKMFIDKYLSHKNNL